MLSAVLRISISPLPLAQRTPTTDVCQRTDSSTRCSPLGRQSLNNKRNRGYAILGAPVFFLGNEQVALKAECVSRLPSFYYTMVCMHTRVYTRGVMWRGLLRNRHISLLASRESFVAEETHRVLLSGEERKRNAFLLSADLIPRCYTHAATRLYRHN